jgi:hypothetical protein
VLGARVSAEADTILFTPENNNTCIGGPSTPQIRVTDTYRGREVATEETDGCEGNGVAERAWFSSLAVPASP